MQTTHAMGARIKALRTERGETQAVVAEAVGIERPSLSMIERGHDRPGLHTLRALADYFGVTLDYLERGSPLPRVEMPANADQSLEEAEVLGLWRRMGETNQAIVTALMEQLSGLDNAAPDTGHQSPPKQNTTRDS